MASAHPSSDQQVIIPPHCPYSDPSTVYSECQKYGRDREHGPDRRDDDWPRVLWTGRSIGRCLISNKQSADGIHTGKLYSLLEYRCIRVGWTYLTYIARDKSRNVARSLSVLRPPNKCRSEYHGLKKRMTRTRA